ncbi:MAG: multicopper oxidase family protein [Acidobacteriia bacterium]|nr:multicopper oxidase family protein [Terriglobia bacterium]
MTKAISKTRLPLAAMAVVALLLTATAAFAAAPGITGPNFNLTATAAYVSQPDGSAVYSWGYGCSGAPSGFAPSAISGAFCNTMQMPGPTLIVTEGQTVQVTLHNNLPGAAGNTSILFPGFSLQPFTDGVPGLLTQEAAPGGTVTYRFTAATPGTRAYYSGTQGDLQIEMGLYGAIIVLPSAVPAACTSGVHASNLAAQSHWGESDFRLAAAAYDHPGTCYDREYLFQFSEIDPRIHRQAEEQSTRGCTGCMTVATEPYVPAYYMVNGRSMPDLMDPNYAPEYPHQPYNGNPHMHPGELTLLRIVGTGRWQHPFHEHGNHVRILGRDGNLILSATDPNSLAGPLLFTTTTTPGLAMDGIYYWSGKGLNWDPYGHNPASGSTLPCTPDANGYNTGAPNAINYFEWCQDHNKPLQAHPFGDVAGGGPVTLPDPNIFANGPWYGGSPYLGPDATTRAVGSTGTTPPSGTVANPPDSEAGFAFMWHSHNEREITTNNSFPGGMLMMMLVDSREFVIDESN